MQPRKKQRRLGGGIASRLVRPHAILVVLLMFSFFCQGCAPVAAVSRGPSPGSIPQTHAAHSDGQEAAREFRTTTAMPVRQSGKASWYGPGFHGKITASGETYDESAMTAAHKSLPLGSKAKVTNLANGNSVEVTINDRGPFIPGRIIDLSRAAARALGIINAGVVLVRVELIRKPATAKPQG